LNVHHLNGLNDGMNQMPVIKILIKITIPAVEIIDAVPVLNPPFHGVKAGPLSGRSFLHFLFPENDSATPSLQHLPPFPKLPVVIRDPHHGLIIMAGCTLVIKSAPFFPDHTGLHPDAFRLPIISILSTDYTLHLSLLKRLRRFIMENPDRSGLQKFSGKI
jgi:hypothetical protein